MLKQWICCDFLTNRRYKLFWHQLAADTSWCSTHQNWVKNHCFWDILLPHHESQWGRLQYVACLSHADSLLCLTGMPQSASLSSSALHGWFCVHYLEKSWWLDRVFMHLFSHRKLTLFRVFRLHVSGVWVMNLLLFALAYCVVV